MRKQLLVGLLCAAGVISAATSPAQVRQASPKDLKAAGTLQEVPSPMLIDISLGEGVTPSGKHRSSLLDTKPGVMRAYTDAANFVCDKASVSAILVRHDTKKGKVILEASPSLTTEYLRQDINLRVALLSGDREVRSQVWERLTIGTDKGAAVAALGFFAAGIGTSRPKVRTARWELSQSEWDDLWKDGKAPTLRVILEIAD